MKKTYKNKAIKKLSDNLSVFHSSLQGKFMCPACLQKISLKDNKEISLAHIIPDAAGGKLKTFLCKKCNSVFGEKQDKWFGEYVRLSNDSKATLLSSKYSSKYIHINGVKVRASVKVDDDGISIYHYTNLNSPETNDAVSQKQLENPGKFEATFSYKPLLDNERLVGIGFLTAGYLMWFDAFGYSWIFQSHLDNIRKQMLNPDENIVQPKSIVFSDKVNWEPWIGFVKLVGGDIYPAMGLTNRIVLLPSKYLTGKYDKLGNELSHNAYTDIWELKFPGRLLTYGSYVICEDKLIVAPDIAHPNNPIVVQIKFDEGDVNFLHPLSKNESDTIEKQSNVRKLYYKI